MPFSSLGRSEMEISETDFFDNVTTHTDEISSNLLTRCQAPPMCRNLSEMLLRHKVLFCNKFDHTYYSVKLFQGDYRMVGDFLSTEQ